MDNIESSECNDSHQICPKILQVFLMKVSYKNSKSAPPIVSILMLPFTDSEKSIQTSDEMIDEAENMENDNDENKDNTNSPVTCSEPLLSTLNNLKVTKRKAINNPTLT